jgi:putative Ig domain-containing protein
VAYAAPHWDTCSNPFFPVTINRVTQLAFVCLPAVFRLASLIPLGCILGQLFKTFATSAIFLLLFHSPLAIAAASSPLSPITSTLTISTSELPQATVKASYSATLAATGGTTPYTWSISSGRLPAGLSLAAKTGTISGTPTSSGNFSFGVKVTDSTASTGWGKTDKTATATVTLTVAAASSPIAPSALSITTSSLPSGAQGTSYSNSIAATGGTTPYSWSVTSGSLPAGLSLASSSGLISGTPTASGTSSFTATVRDSGNPTQTKSVNLSIAVTAASTALAITTSSLPSGTQGSAYSTGLAATGGTTPYTWSIASPTGLPTGLTLASSGLISGTPTATGTSSLTFKVADSSSPVQTKSVTLSLAVAAAQKASALTISANLPSGTVNTGYSSAMTATGGTPAYTWSISAGSLPPGLTLAATSGTISGTPSTSGTYNFTATVSDNGSPVQTQSAATSIVIAAAAATTGSGTTWYIRHDGGTNTQCTGTTNAAYPGSGTGMPCAYNHPFQMLNYSGAWTSFTQGDTIQFADPSTNTVPYYIGEENGGVGNDWSTQMGGVCPAPNSPASSGSGCMLPILPNNVTIKGQNYGNCHTAAHTGLVNPTILSGINGIFTVLYAQGTQGVTISCIEVTQPDNCTSAGSGQGPGQCGSTNNYVGYAGLMLEYLTNQGPANMTLTDFAAVGLANRGILGSHLNLVSTDVFTASDIYVIGNGEAGWDGDGGNCGTSCESVGTMNLSYLDVELNGCLVLKPYNFSVTPSQNPFNYCYGQNTSGYGDGFVQIAAGNLTLNVTHSTFKYNTQDGFDAAHLSDDPNTTPATNISTSWSEGNAGQTFKIGAGASSTAINNVSISNCHVLSQASTFPNNPSGWVTLDGGDTCRAAGDEWSLTLRNGTSVTLENNTSVGYGTTMYDLECSLFNTSCGSNGATLVFTNNISKGYPDPGNAGQLASGIFLGAGLSSANVTASYNLWNTMHTGCPDGTLPGETNFVCADPLLVGESNIDAINPALTSSSPAIGAGTAITGITTDFNGVTRSNPPSIGAEQPQQ